MLINNEIADEKSLNVFSCPVQTTLDILGGKWKLVILHYLIDGEAKRFKELERLITGISPKMLIKELKDLEANQIVLRTQFPTIPPAVEYKLTVYGQKVIPILDVLKEFGEQHLEKVNSKQKVNRMMSED